LNDLVRAVSFQSFAVISGAPVLPDDGVVDRLAGFTVPENRGFSLIGDSNRRDVRRKHLRSPQRLDLHAQLRGPDLMRIVLHPTRAREELSELLLRDGKERAARIEHDGTRAGRALVEREDAAHAAIESTMSQWQHSNCKSQNANGKLLIANFFKDSCEP